MSYRDDRPRVSCKWCGNPTPMLGTKMCDNCWELDHRIRYDLDLARAMVRHYEKERDLNKFMLGGS